MSRQTKWLVGLIAVLVIANMALAASVWLQKKESKTLPPRRDARTFLVKELSLNEAQVKTFDSLRQVHFERMRTYQDQMRRLKDRFFDQLRWPRNAQTDTLAQQIGALQARVELETFDHFYHLRSLLNKEQTQKFDNTIQDVLRTMGPKGGPPPPGEGPPLPDGPPH